MKEKIQAEEIMSFFNTVPSVLGLESLKMMTGGFVMYSNHCKHYKATPFFRINFQRYRSSHCLNWNSAIGKHIVIIKQILIDILIKIL